MSRHRVVAATAYAAALVLLTVAAFAAGFQLRQGGAEHGADVPAHAGRPATGASPHPAVTLAFGAQDVPVASVTVAAQSGQPQLLYFDLALDPVPAPSSRAALVSFRVKCRERGQPVALQATGKVSTNIFLARGGTVSGHALTATTHDALQCDLLASAPFVEATQEGPTSLSVRADLRLDSGSGAHLLAARRLDDATLVEPGATETVLSRRVDDPSRLGRMASTVRLTSCTVVGGSRDAGENQCQTSMTGRESATVRVRVVARWLDEDGSVTGTTTYWDETLAVDHSTHHVPWTLRQERMAERAPRDAQAAVLVILVESVAGTPVVVHADGTDAILTTDA